MKTIKIGRSSQNVDVRVDDSTVSSLHAQLTIHDDGRMTIRDLGSLNGTLVNGVKIQGDKEVKLSDSVQLGLHKLDLASVTAVSPKTHVTPSVSPALPANVKETITIGRSSSNQIRLTGDDVSGHHAMLCVLTDGSVMVIDQNSTNGTFVNGKRVTEARLKTGDHLTITRKYPIDWQGYARKNGGGLSGFFRTSLGKGISYGLGGIAAALLLFFGIRSFIGSGEIDEKECYERYNSAVCWVVTRFGYKVEIEGLGDLFNGKYIVWDDNSEEPLTEGAIQTSGTGFFASTDGRIVTNLHVVKPWLFSDDATKIGMRIRQMLMGTQFESQISQLKITGHVLDIGVVPNGMAISQTTLIGCHVLKADESNLSADVALIQTDNTTVPSSVTNIIDINEAATDPDDIKEGSKVFTIGFPYGSDLGLGSDQILHNQVQSGHITQNRGEYEFGHNASTANGASGSPVLNAHGRLVGVHHAGLTGATGAQGFNMAIKAKYAKQLFE